jgi:hypothetical protein
MEAHAEGLERRPRPPEVVFSRRLLSAVGFRHRHPYGIFLARRTGYAAVSLKVPATVAPSGPKYLAMELIEGSTLKGRCPGCGVEVRRADCDTLDAAHKKGITICDLILRTRTHYEHSAGHAIPLSA